MTLSRALSFDARDASDVSFTAQGQTFYITQNGYTQTFSLSDKITVQNNGMTYTLTAKDIKAAYDLAKCYNQGKSPCLNDPFKVSLESFKSWWSGCSSTLEQWSRDNEYCYYNADRQGSNNLSLYSQKIVAEGNSNANIFTVETDLRTLACGPTASIHIYGGQGQDTVRLKIDRDKVIEKHCADGWVFITSRDGTIDIRLNSVETIQYLSPDGSHATVADPMLPQMITVDHSDFPYPTV